MQQLKVLRTNEEVQALLDYLQDKEFVSYDCESTGIEKGSEIIGFSVCAEVGLAYYVVLHEWDVKTQKLVELETTSQVIDFLKFLCTKKLLMHNATFDTSIAFDCYKVDMMPSVFCDTMLLAHLLDENRRVGLKELAVAIFGEDSRQEQIDMKKGVYDNGGVLTKAKYELYKAPAELIGRYGAKDAELTVRLFYHFIPELYEQKLDQFFFEEETMPLLRLCTVELNRTGLRIDNDRLQKLKKELEVEILEAKGFIYKEIDPIVKAAYPGTSKAKTFNIGANQQISWLLFAELKNEFNTLTKGGRALCKKLQIKVPYHAAAKRAFIREMIERKGEVYEEAKINPKTKKMGRPKKIGNFWQYLSCGKETLALLSPRYKWVAKLLEHAKANKLLNTYVLGIEGKMKYGIIRPSFLQHGTTSGRFSCKSPNFQNLPRDDKRIKACVVARPGNVFVGADHSQLEPRVFSSVSQDKALLECFEKGYDFYSVVGTPVFGKTGCSMFKKDPDSFAELYPDLRNVIKQFALATPYGTSAFQQSMKLGLPSDECERIIGDYFMSYPDVEAMMLDSHAQAKANGVVYSLFGRPRRIPAAMDIPKLYGKNTPHHELPYAARTLLNLAMNHRVQSSAASIMNRNMIATARAVLREIETNPRWKDVKMILQVHDSLILEGPETLAQEMSALLRDAMENSVQLPGVALVAEPKIGYDLSQV